MFLAVWANNYGEIQEAKNYIAMGRTGNSHAVMEEEALIPLPSSSELHFLPGRIPFGKNRRSDKTEAISISSSIHGKREEANSVSAILPPGYTRTYVPSFEKKFQAPTLPFFAYTAVSYKDEKLYAAAVRTEDNFRWDVSQFNGTDLKNKIKSLLKAFPKNRILKHLANCSIEYRCLTAQNIFYQRWEGGIPISPRCNARCVGCISFQSQDLPSAPQSRIRFSALPEEVTELAVFHLNSPNAIVSFGQGCEGEPTMLGGLLEESIKKIRFITSKGTININTNGSKTEIIRRLADAGLDSIRVSINSAVPENYKLYFRPLDYTFDDVKATIKTAAELGIFVSLNLLVMPGVTDNEEELEALIDFARDCSINMIQLRNLNIDPDLYFKTIKAPPGRSTSIVNMIKTFKKELPQVKIGNFTPALR